MVLITSRNGTSATTALKSSGRMFVTAPISSPPALAPRITSRCGAVQPVDTRCSAQAMKSVKVFILRASLPASYQVAAQVAAAAHVREGHHHAAVQQAHARGGEVHVVGNAVGAVAREQQRLRARGAQVAPPHQRHRHLRAVRCRGLHLGAGVARRVVAPSTGWRLRSVRARVCMS
jgi:hypothetical protein